MGAAMKPRLDEAMIGDVDDDRREDARRETYDDQLDRYGLTCEDCEHRYMPGRLARRRGYHLPLCPVCGGNPTDD